MELKEFVKNALSDITGAVNEANNQDYSFTIVDRPDDGIEFNLAILLKKSADGKIGAEIFSVMAAKAEGSISQEHVNRIKFRVLSHRILPNYE